MPVNLRTTSIHYKNGLGYTEVDALSIPECSPAAVRYVTPQMFGAKADGTSDDADAFDRAINSGEAVYVPAGEYYLSRALNNPPNITIEGAGKGLSKIKLNASLLNNEILQSYISNIQFYCDQNNSITVFPQAVRNSIIEGCFFNRFNGIFNGVYTCSTIRDNWFLYVQDFFCKSIVDSFVVGNYINAPKVRNPQTKCFSVNVVHTVIANNFIDYMYKVFAVATASYMNNVTVIGNIFDVCYCIFYNVVNGVTFTGNTLSNMRKRNNWDVSGNTEMDTTEWCVIKRVDGYSNIARAYFGGNSFDNNSGDGIEKYLVCKGYGYPTTDFVIDEPLPADYFNFMAYKSSYTRDFEGVDIRPMKKRTVQSLPSAALSGNATTFNYDEVIYNGNLYINLNGSWVQVAGN